jgi:hypothetical protein
MLLWSVVELEPQCDPAPKALADIQDCQKMSQTATVVEEQVQSLEAKILITLKSHIFA